MGKKVLAISGSLSAQSRTAALVDAVLAEFRSHGVATEHVTARGLDPAALLTGDVGQASLATLISAVRDAHGLIIATPIYKASFTGLLKAALDILPQFALAGKVVLPMGTGGSVAHVLALDYGLRPVIQSMGARHIVQSHFVVEGDLPKDGRPISVNDQAWGGLRHACANFLHSLTDAESAATLGHPRPAA